MFQYWDTSAKIGSDVSVYSQLSAMQAIKYHAPTFVKL